jgi:integrase
MPTVRMTDRFVAATKFGEAAKLVEFFDEVVSGLCLRITRGTKTWSFFYTAPGSRKRARVGLGHYPATSLAAARARAIEAASLVEGGEDPRHAFAASTSSATVADLVESYVILRVRSRKLRTADQIEQRMRKNILPAIGAMRLAEVHRRDITRVTDRLLKRGSPSEANHVFADLRALFGWAVARGDIDHTPVTMKKPADVGIRDRVLTDEEIHALWNGLPDWLVGSRTCARTTGARIIRLCLVTSQRLGEVAGMRRAELDLKGRLWRLPPDRVKNKTEHSVPLSDLAMTIIEEALAAVGADSELVFTGRAGAAISPRLISGMILGSRLFTKAYPAGRCPVANWSAHDLRRTAITGMARLGVEPIVFGHVANHRTTTRAGVTLAVYSQYTYDEEKRAALDLWAERLSAIISGTQHATIHRLGSGAPR